MMTEKFKDLFDFAPKSKVKAGDGLNKGNFPFYTSSSVLKKRSNKAQHFDEALIFGTGGSASIHFSDEPFATSTDCLVAKKKQKTLNTKFAYYYLFGNIHLLERGFKGAGIKHISRKYIENSDIPILPIEIQNKIVSVLDKASVLVSKREETIKLLDELLKSSFWHIFGDLGCNNFRWPKHQLVYLCKDKSDVRCGPFGTQLNKSEFKTKGVPLWGIKHVNADFKISTNEFVSSKKAKDLSNYLLQARDIVMTRKGTIGNSHVYPEDFENGIMHSDILRIRVDEDRVNPYFLSYQFKYNEVLQWQISKVSPGVVMAGINVSKLKKIEIVIPEKRLQDKFENNFKEIEKIKNTLIEYDVNNLFLSILQKAFNNQLNFNIDFELDALIREIDLQKKENDLSKLSGDIAYLQRLVDKLNTQEFKEKDLYDKAKYAAFQFMTVKEQKKRITQEYNEKTKSIELALK